jgi:hypothetical protein
VPKPSVGKFDQTALREQSKGVQLVTASGSSTFSSPCTFGLGFL